MNTAIRRSTASLLVVSVTTLGTSSPVQAGIASTEKAITARVAMLDRSEAHSQLEARGVSPADAQARVAALTDQEVAALAKEIDAHSAGGGAQALLVTRRFFTPVMALGSAINSLGKRSAETQRTPADDASPFPAQR